MRSSRLLGALAILAALTGVATAGEKSVKIGVLTDLTSFASTAMGPGSVLAGQLAVEHFGGEVLGKPVELISADMQSKPDLAVQIARRWYEAENVDLIVDVPASAAAIAIQAMATEKDRMFMATVAATPVLTLKGCSPNAVHWVNNTSSLARSPGQLPSLMRTAISARTAFAALSRGRRLLGLRFGYGDLRELDVDVA